MFGNRNFNKGNRQNRNQASSGICICPKCGYSFPHTKGIPCSSVACPNCKIALVRNDKAMSSQDIMSTGLSNKEKCSSTPPAIIYPKVNPELCTGCGVCIDNCPNDAIILKADKAFIVENLCKNCKKCVRVCPSEAIQ